MHRNYNKYTSSLLFILFIIIINLSCKKYGLLKSEAQPSTPAGVNNKNETIWQFVSENNFHASDLTNLTLYGKAIQRAGLQGLLDSTDNYTVILPSDTAINQFIHGLGYQQIDDVPVPILRNLLLDNIFEGSVHSYDLNIGETKKFQTLNGDYVYFSRQSSSSDTYILYINQSDSLSSTAVQVRTQDINLKNGVVQVVDQFTYYALKKVNPDPIDTSKITVSVDTFFVSKDVTLRPGQYKNKNYNDPNEVDLKGTTHPNFTRHGLVQYPLAKPSFGDKIGTAKIHFYFFLATLSNFDLSLSTSNYEDWDEKSITYNTAPAYNSVPVISGNISSSQIPGWVAFDVTPAITNALSQDQTFISFRIRTSVDGNFSFRSREYLDGYYASYMTLSSPPKTILTLGTNVPVSVDAKSGYKIMSLDNLKMNGTADKNIFYIVQSMPQNGYLVLYGIPLAAGSTFSQDDIAKGGVKYLYNGSGTSDQLTLEAKDFQGGYFPDPLIVNFQIQ